ncbi:FAD-dependent oxidoreductase, partial [Rhizobium ruizarguesonis]
IRILCHDTLQKVSKGEDGLILETLNNGTLQAGVVMLALGRDPNTEGLGLEAAGVAVDQRGAVNVDEYSRNKFLNIYALG